MNKQQWLIVGLLVALFVFLYFTQKTGATYTYNPCQYGRCQPTVTPTVTPTIEVTPTATPSATPTPETGNGGTPPTFAGSSTEAPKCDGKAPTKIGDNFHIYRKGEDVIAKWWPTEGNHVNIYYVNINDESDRHALRDVANDGYEDNLHNLGSKDWRFGLQQADNCAGGPIVWVDDGSTTEWVLFR